jgi:DNA-binding CsgD family transcriptional regulator
MLEITLPKNHILYASANDVADICEPLQKYLQIAHFSFVRIYDNGERAHLSMNPELQEFFYKKFHTYVQRDNLTNNTKGLHNGYTRWDDMFTFELFSDVKQYFNTANGLVLVNKENDFVELMFIGGIAADLEGTERYIAHLDLLEQFLVYFKQRAAHLLTKAEKQRILTPATPVTTPLPKIYSSLTSARRQQFLQELNSDRLKITPREHECLQYIAQGLSMKQIAEQCGNISPRTVEHHLENIKSKFGCNKMTQVINKASELGLVYSHG